MKHSYLLSYNSALKKYTKQVDKQVLNKLLKTIHDDTPSMPRYTAIWDVNKVLTFISAMRTDNIMLLSQKLATLLMLLSGNRVNMLTHMHITEGNMILTDEECSFRFTKALKHTRPGIKNDIMTFRSFKENISLCPVHTIMKYLQLRSVLCGDSNLFIRTRPPYAAAHHDTIARWIKTTLKDAGIDTDIYKAHSCRHASTSAASIGGVSLKTIMGSASWSNDNTFYKHYKKEIDSDDMKDNFGSIILKQFSVTDVT